jgi:hypothetical protein
MIFSQPFKISEQLTTLVFVVYLAWVVLGVLFYHYYDEWSFPTSFFYALEVGMSVGFCAPVCKC